MNEEQIQLSPFTYQIRSDEVAEVLIERGFLVVNQEPGDITIQAPESISATKARKIISIVIKLFTAAKEVSRAQERYQELVDRLEEVS